jgi:hypothetical protein
MAIDPKTLQVQSYDWRWLGDTKIPETTYGYSLSTNQGRFTFIPESVVSKGFIGKDRQYYFDDFLDKKFLTNFYQNAALVDFADYTDFKDGQLFQQRLNSFNQGTKGFLVPESFVTNNLRTVQSYNLNTKAGKATIGAIQGVGEKDGRLVYIPQASGANNVSAYIVPGTKDNIKATYTRGGFLGDIANAIASVPFLPEIAGLATGNPYVYASLKGIQAGVAGEDPLKAGLKVGATLLAANAIGSPSSPTSAGTGITPGAAGITGLTPGAAGATGLAAPSGFVFSPELGATLATSAALNQPASTDLLSGTTFPQQGLQVPPIDSSQVALVPQGTVLPGEGLLSPTLPSVGAMGGAQGLSVGVPGGTITQAGLTPTGAVPGLGDPASFINNPDVLGQPVITPEASTISLQQALRGAQLANQLLNPPEFPGMQMDGGQQPRLGGVDYSGLLGLLQARAGLPNVSGLLSPAQIRYPSSLLG